MPTVPVLLEVIGGERTLAVIDPGHSASRTAEALAALVGLSLVDDDGRPRAWKLYAPNEGAGYDVVPAASNLLPIAMRMRRAQQGRGEVPFGGPGELDGAAYLFRLRLFVPVRPASTGTTADRLPTIPDDEAVDLTQIDEEPAPPPAGEGRNPEPPPERKPKPGAKKKRATQAEVAPVPERPARSRKDSIPAVPPVPAPGVVAEDGDEGPLPFGLGPDPTRERVSMKAPSMGADGSLRANAGTPYASGDTVLIHTVEARPVPAGSIGPEPENVPPAPPRRSPSVRAPTPKPRPPRKRTPSALIGVGVGLILLLIASFVVFRLRTGGTDGGDPGPVGATPARGSAGTLLDDLAIAPYPALLDPADPLGTTVATYAALGIRTREDTARADRRPLLLELETKLRESCASRPGFEACDALATVALAAAFACRTPGCPDEAAAHLKWSAEAVEASIPRAANMPDGPARQDAHRRATLNAIRLGSIVPATFDAWAPNAGRIARKACADQPSVAQLAECGEIRKLP